MARLSLDQDLPSVEVIKYLDKVNETYSIPGWLHFRRAVCYQEAGEFRKALAAYNWAERTDGPSISTIRQQAICWMDLGEWKKALAETERGLKFRKVPDLAEMKADILVELERYDDALQVYDEVTQGLDRAFARAYVMERRGDYQQGIKEVDKALEQFPTDAELMARRGYLKSCQGDLDGARWDYSLSLILQHDPALLARRAILDVDLGRFEDAARDAELSLTLDPNGELPLKAMAVVLEAIDSLEGAALYWQRYVAASGDEHGVLLRAEILNRMGREEECDSALEEYIELFPDSWEGLYYRVAVARARRHFELALAHCEHALALHPAEETLLYEKALIYFEWDRFSQAEKACEDLLGAHPDSQDAKELQVDILAEFAPERALVMVDQLLAEDCSAPNLFRKGYALAQAGKFREALPLLDLVLREEPENPDYLEARSLVRSELGQLEGALRDAELGLEKEPERTWLKMHRAYLNLRRGNLSASEEEARELLHENLFYRYRLFCRGLLLGARIASRMRKLWPGRE